MRLRTLTFAAVVPLLIALLPAAPASAAARVTVRNPAGAAAIAASGSTTLRLSGAGFQSVRGGFGGIYVLFGAVSGNWRPSAHGGGSMYYLRDSQQRDNAGRQRFVAFPGDSTAGAANGGTLSAAGTWSTTLIVPGSRFTGVGPGGATKTVDCRTMTCGVITIGAHGVVNGRNETFTPVRVSQATAPATESTTSGSATPDTDARGGTQDGAHDGTQSGGTPSGEATAPVGKPRLRVDRASAAAGRVLAFTARGLPPGRQLSVVLDDGLAGAGPLTVGADGTLAGVIEVPVDAGPGTHELRLVGVPKAPSVRFPLLVDQSAPAPGAEPVSAVTAERDIGWQPVAFVTVAALALLASMVFAALRHRRRRHVG